MSDPTHAQQADIVNAFVDDWILLAQAPVDVVLTPNTGDAASACQLDWTAG